LGFESLPGSFCMHRVPIALLLVLLALPAGVAACGGGGDDEAASTATPEPRDDVQAIVDGISKDTSEKPQIAAPQGQPPGKIVTRDIVRGTGRKAKRGDTLTMQYVGVSWSTGEQFDASWDRGQPFPFRLGAGMVIQGWDKGMVGMRKGGRRLLVIPPDMGYGPAGQGPIGPNETLIFAVDLVDIG
jgi:peptidylprolyl isomerase